MKKVGICQNCGRNVYTNDIDLCKRCYQIVGMDVLGEEEIEEEPEEGPSLEELGIEAPEEGSEVVEETPQEETKEKKE